MTERLGAQLEIKSVDFGQRLINGYANYFGNEDLNGDIVMKGAFSRTLTDKPLNQIAPIIGHDASKIRVGMPVDIHEDDNGLWTSTRIFKTTAGDDLLQTAREMQAAGVPLGMSIGFRTVESEPRRIGQKTVRALLACELFEYSFADPAFIANTKALVQSVKTRQQKAEERSAAVQDAPTGHFAVEFKAVWSAAEQNDLPDSAFAYISPGGHKDDQGKTVPRSLRHYPHHDPDGKVDPAHLRNALARAAQNPSTGQKAIAHLEAHAKALGIGEEQDDGKMTHDALAEVSGTLADMSNEAADVADSLRIGGRLGLDGQKVGSRLRGSMRAKLKAIIESLSELAKWTEYSDDDPDAPKTAKRALDAAHLAIAVGWDAKAVEMKAHGDVHDALHAAKAAHDGIDHDCPYTSDGKGRKAMGSGGDDGDSDSDPDDYDTGGTVPHLHKAINAMLDHHEALHDGKGHDYRKEWGWSGSEAKKIEQDDEDEKDPNNPRAATSRNGAGEGWKSRKEERELNAFLKDLNTTLAQFETPANTR